ncbi:endo alpha-1,4 polygalactosaminidase [Aquicella siphonis]|uniref:endo alpha-1,4 polygalactosaminidase n=1 Tax=Aquicella siphonis TaxID=254247 RepID=UPI0011DCA527
MIQNGFAKNEQRFQYKECEALIPFINSGKAVFNVEYKLSTSNFFSKAASMKFSSIKKKLSLGNPVTFCN